MKYTHLNRTERQLIYDWYHVQKRGIREISRRLSRHHSTISREIKRNINTTYVPTYHCNVAHYFARNRLTNRSRRYRLKNKETRSYIIEKLQLGWSPEIISGRLALITDLENVSYESIYQYIYKEDTSLIAFLARKHKTRRKKYPYRSIAKSISSKVFITQRPDHIDTRETIGHWESDSIESSSRGGLNVIIERSCRLVHISKIPTKHASCTKNVIINKLIQHDKKFVKSITYDNGTENYQHMSIDKKLGTKSYFCLPYHSWEKGSVEQVNGLIRRYLPKGTDISKVSHDRITEIENLLNNRPRKCLNYRTPYEVYHSKGGALQP